MRDIVDQTQEKHSNRSSNNNMQSQYNMPDNTTTIPDKSTEAEKPYNYDPEALLPQGHPAYSANCLNKSAMHNHLTETCIATCTALTFVVAVLGLAGFIISGLHE